MPAPSTQENGLPAEPPSLHARTDHFPIALLKRLAPVLLLVTICWLAFLINNGLAGGHFLHSGIIPRQRAGLIGVLWAPFLHASLKHLAANTVPLLLLGAILCSRSRLEFVLVTVAGILLGGGLTWLVARNGCHIGASGLVFCFFGYLASLALFKRTFGTLALSVGCVLIYGGMLRGLVPTATPVSWEAHFTGFATGVAMAWLASRFGKKPAITPPAQAPEVP